MQSEQPRKKAKNNWTVAMDKNLKQFVQFYGGKLSWNQLSGVFPGQTGRSIRQRYYKFIDISSNKAPWSEE